MAFLTGHGYITLIITCGIPTVPVVVAVFDVRVMHYLAHFVSRIGFGVRICAGNCSFKFVVLSRVGMGTKGTEGRWMLPQRVWGGGGVGNLLPRRGCA